MEVKASWFKAEVAETTGQRVKGFGGKEARLGFSIVLGEAMRRENAGCGEATGRVGLGIKANASRKLGPPPSPCGPGALILGRWESNGNAKPASSRKSWSNTGIGIQHWVLDK